MATPTNAQGLLTITFTDESGNVVWRGVAKPSVFSAGSEGWNASDKMTSLKGVRYQIGVNVTEIGSKGRHAVAAK